LEYESIIKKAKEELEEYSSFLGRLKRPAPQLYFIIY